MTETRKPAICVIVENLPVRADRRVWQEANALVEAGYSVSVICPKGRGFHRSHETVDGIEIYAHPTLNASGVAGHVFEYAWALAAEFALALRVYARTRFRILQACNPPDTIFPIALFFKLFGVRFIFDHHDLAPELCRVRFAKPPMLHRPGAAGSGGSVIMEFTDSRSLCGRAGCLISKIRWAVAPARTPANLFSAADVTVPLDKDGLHVASQYRYCVFPLRI